MTGGRFFEIVIRWCEHNADYKGDWESWEAEMEADRRNYFHGSPGDYR
jgi:hypothetical protein